MKHLIRLFCILSFLQTNILTSQVYQPLGVEDATWIFKGYGEIESTAWAYKISGDTLVNNQQYKKLYHVDLTVQFNPGQARDYLIADTNLFALVRDDIQNKKVYIKYLDYFIYENFVPDSCLQQVNTNDNEFLLLDFAKNIGDNFDDCMTTFVMNQQIKTDTLLNIYGTNRRSMSLRESDADPDNFIGLIEGVGYTSGLFQDFGFIFHAGKGLVFKYCVGSNIDCGLLSASEEVIQQSEFQIYPNPTNDYLTLESSYRFVHARILNISGQVVSSISDWNGLNTVDVSDHTPGIYFIEVQTKDNKISRRRFVKE